MNENGGPTTGPDAPAGPDPRLGALDGLIGGWRISGEAAARRPTSGWTALDYTYEADDATVTIWGR